MYVNKREDDPVVTKLEPKPFGWILILGVAGLKEIEICEQAGCYR